MACLTRRDSRGRPACLYRIVAVAAVIGPIGADLLDVLQTGSISIRLKRRLAERYPTHIEAYMDGKDGFIQAADINAAAYRRQSQT